MSPRAAVRRAGDWAVFAWSALRLLAVVSGLTWMGVRVMRAVPADQAAGRVAVIVGALLLVGVVTAVWVVRWSGDDRVWLP